MIAAIRRFFRRFQPRILHISLIDDQGRALIHLDEKTAAILASLQGSGRMLDQKFNVNGKTFRLVLVVSQ